MVMKIRKWLSWHFRRYMWNEERPEPTGRWMYAMEEDPSDHSVIYEYRIKHIHMIEGWTKWTAEWMHD
jgi:hypothetical protein